MNKARTKRCTTPAKVHVAPNNRHIGHLFLWLALAAPLIIPLLFGVLLFVQAFMAGLSFLVLAPFAYVARAVVAFIAS